MLCEFVDVFVQAEVLLVLGRVKGREHHHASRVQTGHLGVLEPHHAQHLPTDCEEAVAGKEPPDHGLNHNGEPPLPLIPFPHHISIYYLGQVLAELTQTPL